MPVSEARKRANRKYDKKTYEIVSFRMRIGRKAEVQSFAASVGESFNEFLNNAIDEKIERDAEILKDLPDDEELRARFIWLKRLETARNLSQNEEMPYFPRLHDDMREPVNLAD